MYLGAEDAHDRRVCKQQMAEQGVVFHKWSDFGDDEVGQVQKRHVVFSICFKFLRLISRFGFLVLGVQQQKTKLVVPRSSEFPACSKLKLKIKGEQMRRLKNLIPAGFKRTINSYTILQCSINIFRFKYWHTTGTHSIRCVRDMKASFLIWLQLQYPRQNK